MNQFPCPTCGHPLTAADVDCPSCGLPLREVAKKLSWRWVKFVALAVLIGGLVGVFTVSSMLFAWLMVAGGVAFVVGLALD